MIEFLASIGELFEIMLSLFMLWRYIFSKRYRTQIKERWASGDPVKRTVIILNAIFSSLINAVIILAIIYLLLL